MGEERLLVPVRTDVSAPVEIMALNETGSVLWGALGAPTDLGALGEALSAEFDVEPEVARADAEKFLSEMLRLGLVEQVPA